MFANNADDILARSTVETWVIKGEKGDVDVCKKCEGKVYEAEKLTTAAVSNFTIFLKKNKSKRYFNQHKNDYSNNKI